MAVKTALIHELELQGAKGPQPTSEQVTQLSNVKEELRELMSGRYEALLNHHIALEQLNKISSE